MSLRKANGEKPSKSLHGTLRSSLFHLFRRYDVPIPTEFAAELTIFFKGLKRTVAHRIEASGTKMTEGKEPFDFSMYQSICRTMSVQCGKEFVFAHAFLVLSWNLMCQAGNAVSIRFEHVKWYQDAMAIRFGHMKNDQDGERQRDPRHIYANPVVPEICPVLSLAVYFSIFGFDSSSHVFPGGNQYDRYSKVLKRAMMLSPTKDIMESNGFTPTDFGSHSARKGSATFVSSCSTAGPSALSICLRAGWSLPGVQDTYVRYEAAGDRVVGRFVAGLPFETSQFAILPPFFPDPSADVDRGCSLCFPSAPVHMKSMCSFMLASLVYHYDYLEASLPRNHLLFSSALFREVSTLMTLKNRVVCRCALRGDSLRPTGVPPHIGILVSMDAMTDRFKSAISSIEQIVPAVSREFHSVANNLNDCRGFVSSDSIDRAVISAIDRSGMNDVVELLRQHVHPSANLVDTTHQTANDHDPLSTTSQNERQYTSGDLATRWWSHELPANFTFPKVTVAQAWELWLFGSVRNQYPPFCRIQPGDLPTLSARKRLSDFRYLMKAIEQAVREDDTLNSIHTLNQARHRLGVAIGRLHILDRTAKNYTRRRDQLQWSTVVNLLRKSSKDSCVSRS